MASSVFLKCKIGTPHDRNCVVVEHREIHDVKENHNQLFCCQVSGILYLPQQLWGIIISVNSNIYFLMSLRLGVLWWYMLLALWMLEACILTFVLYMYMYMVSLFRCCQSKYCDKMCFLDSKQYFIISQSKQMLVF